MGTYNLQYKSMGENAILVQWPNEINDSILDDIISFSEKIRVIEKEEMCNYASGYNSILVHYKNPIIITQKIDRLQSIYETNTSSVELIEPTIWYVPVCYDEEFGLDLNLYRQKGLSIDQVIAMHTSKPYRVYMIGFVPGFLYLGGLQKELHLPRKENPRQRVVEGSVAIGGEQTGIYPKDSPGGWQIIGRTPLTLFDIHKEPPISVRQGDYIHFKSIDKAEFNSLRS